MTSISPEQLSAIKQITTDISVQINVVLKIPIDVVNKFICSISEFVTNSNVLHRTHYLIVLDRNDPKAHTSEVLTAELILRNLGVGNKVFFTDLNLNLTHAEKSEIRNSDSARITAEKETLGILVQGTYLSFILNGICIDEFDVLMNRECQPWPSNLHHPISEFESLLFEHKKNWLDDEKAVRYWSDKRRRILYAGPENTESIFHRSLFTWLNLHLVDYLKIFAEPGGFGQNKTDITVVTPGGCTVIEVKWLGINQSGTEYGHDQIGEGITQIKLYLDKEDYIRGFLTIYDGRTLRQNKNESDYEKGSLHSKCAPPYIIFLESDTPSIAARKLQREGR